jgi:hypothetical protein
MRQPQKSTGQAHELEKVYVLYQIEKTLSNTKPVL